MNGVKQKDGCYLAKIVTFEFYPFKEIEVRGLPDFRIYEISASVSSGDYRVVGDALKSKYGPVEPDAFGGETYKDGNREIVFYHFGTSGFSVTYRDKELAAKMEQIREEIRGKKAAALAPSL
jgi:hypothetical protein